MILPPLAWAAMLAAAPVAATVPDMDVTVAPGTDPTNEDIIVTGMGENGYRLTADQLRDAVRAFERGRAEFAPQARLMWEVRPSTAAQNLSLRLTNGQDNVDVAISPQGSFVLPHDLVMRGGYRLASNVSRGQLRIRPAVYSPGADETNLRMGDVRLTCRVFWAFQNNELGFLTRVGFSAIGGCSSRRIGIYWGVERDIADVAIDGYADPIDIRANRRAFRLPLHIRALENDARVRVQFAN